MKRPFPSFYITGGTMPRDAPSYVEREADGRLLDGLRRGEFCYVLTSRQMGKSSLMVRTAAKLRMEGVSVAVVDLSALGQNVSPDQWYRGVASRIGRQLELEEEIDNYWTEHEEMSPLARWAAVLEQIVLTRTSGRIVVFVDEVDAIRSLPFSTDEFFAAIRSFYNRRAEEPLFGKLTFCLLGVASPADLIRDPRLTPFNIGRRVVLDDFSAEEAAHLATGLGERPFSSPILRRILYWTNGHPYLTQKICRAVVDASSAKDDHGIEPASPRLVDRILEKMYFSGRAWELDENLLFVREQVLRSSEDTARLLELYRAIRSRKRVVDDETNPLVGLLRLSGLARASRGYLHIRNRIYDRVFNAAWIVANLPDADINRQRAAFRRGVIRATTVASVALVVVGALGSAAFLSARQLKQRERELNHLLAISSINLADQAISQRQVARAVELLNFVPQGERSGFVWRHLWRLCHRSARLLETNREGITSLAVSPDGSRVAATDERVCYLWNAEDGMRIPLEGQPAPGTAPAIVASTGVPRLTCVAFSPDGRWFVAGDSGNRLSFWSLDGKLIRQVTLPTSSPAEVPHPGVSPPPAGIRILAVSPDSRLVAAARDAGQIRVWSVTRRREVFAAKLTPERPTRIAFSPDGAELAVCSLDGTMKRWSSAGWKELPAIHGMTLAGPKQSNLAVESFAYSPDGRWTAIATNDRAIRLFDRRADARKAGEPASTIETWADMRVNALAFSQDGARLAAGCSDRAIRLWSVVNREQIDEIAGHTRSITEIAFGPRGRTIYSGSQDGSVRAWSDPPLQRKASLAGPAHFIDLWGLSPDGLKIARLGASSLRLLSDEPAGGTPRVAKSIEETDGPFTFMQNGRILEVAAFRNGILELYRVSDGARTGVIQTPPKWTPRAIAVTSDKSLLAAALRNVVEIWQPGGKVIKRLEGHGNAVAALAFSGDGSRLASGSWDGTTRVWDPRTGALVWTLLDGSREVTAVAFSPEGTVLLTGNADGEVRWWDLATGRDLLVRRLSSRPIHALAATSGRVRAIDDQGTLIDIHAEP